MRRPNLARLLVAATLPVLVLSACGGDADGPADTTAATVTIETFNFQPDPIMIAAGTTITFVNEDAIDHTVTAGTRESPTPELFDGRLPEQGATFELTLEEPGTYAYFCEIHPGPGMTGSITVR